MPKRQLINYGTNFPEGGKKWQDGLLKGAFQSSCRFVSSSYFVLPVIPAPSYLFDASEKDGAFLKPCIVTADKKDSLLLRCEAMLCMLAGREKFYAPLPKKITAKKALELEPYVQHVSRGLMCFFRLTWLRQVVGKTESTICESIFGLAVKNAAWAIAVLSHGPKSDEKR